MNILYILYGSLGFLLTLSLLFIVLILTQKRRHRTKEQKVSKARDYLFKKYLDGEDPKRPVSRKFFFEALIDVDEQIHLDADIREKIIADICAHRFMNKQKKHLHSKFTFRRKIAAFYIGRTRTKEAYQTLFERFKIETNEAVKLRLISQLRYGLNETTTKVILESLINASENYHHRLTTLLGSNYKRIHEYFPDYQDDDRYDIVLALVRIAAFHSDAFLVDYMQKKLAWVSEMTPFQYEKNNRIITIIMENLLRHTPEILNNENYLNHRDDRIKKYAVLALAIVKDEKALTKIIQGIDRSELDVTRIEALSQRVFTHRKELDEILNNFHNYNAYQKHCLIYVLADRIDYIFLKHETLKETKLKEILVLMFEENILEPIIDFLNRNRDPKLNRIILNHIKPLLSKSESQLKEFRKYSEPEILEALGVTKLAVEVSEKSRPPLEKNKIRWLIRWLILNLLLFPIIYLLRHNLSLITMTWQERIEGFIIDVNIYLIVYFVIINSVYISLLVFAMIGSKKQVRLAQTKKYALLFTDRLLPGISIIAPAYNEEISIIESVTSLLNLKYPSYEVVVVNDGSKDQTLEILIAHFNLERKHFTYKQSLGTKPVRGIYTTKTIPNLVVVDKQNGGKADALNVGINISKHPYVCGIDADSILEGDALLKLASAMLDDTAPFVALGGNIYPANGFTFDKGKVEKRGLPKETLCRFQTIEYLRAFTSGRIGWSELRSLMIISGAFGLFKRDVLIETGGYLTSSSIHQKDTVGEDMELVVRLTKQALEKKQPFRVAYVYNAYCYTELPSDLKTLLKQRNRWQRGLIDILSYHRDLAFKPKYKQIGFIGYPYYFIFEFMGPFLEAQGYIMLIIALILGLLNPVIVLGIFTASIVFGVMISLSALYMTEREILMLNRKETLILILFAIIENFGYRQFVSMHRVTSTFKALRETGQWGTQKRKGFKA